MLTNTLHNLSSIVYHGVIGGVSHYRTVLTIKAVGYSDWTSNERSISEHDKQFTIGLVSMKAAFQ